MSIAGKLFSLSNAILDIRKCDNMIGWTLERYTHNTRVENQFYIYSGVTRHSQRNSGARVLYIYKHDQVCTQQVSEPQGERLFFKRKAGHFVLQ